MKRLIALLAVTLALLAIYSCEKTKQDEPEDETLEVNEANLKGTWEGGVEHDFAQGYYQRWRIQFDGKNYTSWHTHLTAGSTKDDVQGVKTVGNKEQGTWEYVDGALVLTPKKMWASYYFAMTSIQTGDGKYVYYNYNPETMEADEWYETPEDLVKAGVEQDLNASNPIAYMYIKSWPVVGFADTELSIKINMDVFKLDKQ